MKRKNLANKELLASIGALKLSLQAAEKALQDATSAWAKEKAKLVEERDAACAEAAALQKDSNVLKLGKLQKQLKAAGKRFNTKKEELKKQTQLSVDYASQLKAVS